MREYTKCYDCGAIFPCELEEDYWCCPVCGKAGLVSLVDVDVEGILAEAEQRQRELKSKRPRRRLGKG
jgi:hypothetical protein